MSCNGCRVLRKGCSESCALRSCLRWIPSPEAQGNATLFLARFFGRSDLMSLINAVPDHQRPSLFQSLLFEACGRTVNPVNGAVGLLWSGNWRVISRHVAPERHVTRGIGLESTSSKSAHVLKDNSHPAGCVQRRPAVPEPFTQPRRPMNAPRGPSIK